MEYMELDQNYLGKLYGGWIGKVIGVIHGANVEGWTYEEIKRTFGEIRDYPFRFRNFCADDDINGPVFFMRALKDYAHLPQVTLKEMSETFLNYVSDGHGFFWWGGYGISTEHTAYQNLIDGIPAPRCGSAAQNGRSVANQIGGQIFSDCWGLLYPGRPDLAAEAAGKMSSITHDENGIYGGRFIAACIAAAFTAENVEEILEAGLAQIPVDCEYASMVQNVKRQCRKYRGWEDTFHYVQEVYGYQNYSGSCHIIPNAAVIVLALLYGDGDYSNTINIANMCGWDTDCNVGNLGTILGVFCGIEGIDPKWLPQVGDFICGSGSLGYLNIQTVSQAAALCASITYRLYEKEPEDVWKTIFAKPEGQYFHFEFPTAVHAMRGISEEGLDVNLSNVEGIAHSGNRSLKVCVPGIENKQSFVLYHKSYYVPGDFDDNRYQPDFSPTVYPGDTVKLFYRFDEAAVGARIQMNPYVTDRIRGRRLPVEFSSMTVADTNWQEFSYQIPEGDNLIVQDVGIEVICMDVSARETKCALVMYVDDVEIRNKAAYRIDCGRLPLEKWTAIDFCPAGFTYLRGIAELLDGRLCLSGSGRDVEVYTGNVNWRDIRLEAEMEPLVGEEHYLLFRVQGCRRCYAAGFRNGKAVLLKKEGEFTTLAETEYELTPRQRYNIKVRAVSGHLELFINGVCALSCVDEINAYTSGCIGFGNGHAARTAYTWYKAQEI